MVVEGCRKTTCLLTVLMGVLIVGCRKKAPEPPPPPPRVDRPAEGQRREVAHERVRTPLACVRDGEVWLMDGDGNQQHRVRAPGRAVPESLQWAPDSGRLAFWTVEASAEGYAGRFRLCVAEVSGESAEVLYTTQPGLGGDRPVFSADGGRIYASVFGGTDDRGKDVGGLFAQRFVRNKGVLIFGAEGGEPQRLLPKRPLSRGPLRWLDLAPDGKSLLAIGGRDLGRSYVVLANLSSRKATEHREVHAEYAVWCPRRRRMAYLRPGEAGALELRIWTPEKNTDRSVVGGLNPKATFAWGPDGKTIAYTNGDEYAIVAEAPTGAWVRTREVQQNGSMHRWPTWAPNGKAIVLEVRRSGERRRILQRDALDPSIAAKYFFSGGQRPVFAPG